MRAVTLPDGNTKLPSVHATSVRGAGVDDSSEHVRVRAEHELRACVQARRRELLLP